MTPAPYLLHVNSAPKVVSGELWTKWYIDEHLPDLVNSKTSERATFYEEVPVPGLPPSSTHRQFLALYQTNFQECLKTENYTNLRTTSEIFSKEGGEPGIGENGDFDARNYELIQTFDPKNIGEGDTSPDPICTRSLTHLVAPPYLTTVEMYPSDEADYDKWYREEHLDMMTKLLGYRRSLRYKLGPKTALTKDDDPPTYLAVHEFDGFDAIGTPEYAATVESEWTKKNVKASKVLIARMWKKVHAEGF